MSVNEEIELLAVMARVTKECWVTTSVLDKVRFALPVGGTRQADSGCDYTIFTFSDFNQPAAA